MYSCIYVPDDLVRVLFIMFWADGVSQTTSPVGGGGKRALWIEYI